MKPPLLCPMKYTSETGTSDSSWSRRPVRYATSSTPVEAKSQQAGVAFQKRRPPESTVPSGVIR
ncbi:MAG TPA: hypothetical protein DEF51_11455 [Myxococcales bacterium]|nr:hypothetical protein [Myxococcales bacterium]